MIHILKKEESAKIFSELYILYGDFFSEQRTYSNHYQFEYSEQEFVNTVKEEIASGSVVYLYLNSDESIVGFLRGRNKNESKSFLLQDLYIKPEHRGRGYGRQLFLKLKSDLAGSDTRHIDILVDVNNKTGLAFWEKMDFSPRQFKMSHSLNK